MKYTSYNCGNARAESASSTPECCRRLESGCRIRDTPSAAAPRTSPAAGGRYTRSGSCRMPAPGRRSPMPEQGPPLSFAQNLPIYTDYTVILQALLSTKVTDRAAPGYPSENQERATENWEPATENCLSCFLLIFITVEACFSSAPVRRKPSQSHIVERAFSSASWELK